LFQASDILLSVERSASLLNGGDFNARASGRRSHGRQKCEICRGVCSRSSGDAAHDGAGDRDKRRDDFTGNV
jgi:hypothetical protein